MTERGRFSQMEVSTGAIIAVTGAVLTWYRDPGGVQGATNATIAATVSLAFFFVGLLALKRWNPSWYSPL